MKQTKRFLQNDFTINFGDFPQGWNFEKCGCLPSSIANCLINLGFDVDPITVLRKIYIGKDGNFDKTYLVSNGTRMEGLIYALERFKNEDNFPIEYYQMKVDFDNPESQRNEVINNLKNGYLAIIHIGPAATPTIGGHYSVVSDVDDEGNFFIIDSGKQMADTHMKKAFPYAFIIKNIFGRKDSLNFLFIRRI